MLYHTDEYNSKRSILGLQDLSALAYYDPAAALIFAKRETQSYFHEMLHLHQLSATTVGLALTAALAYRNMCVEFRVKALNEKFNAGLWSPVLGWLDDLYQGSPEEFHDSEYPYFHLSYLKRWIGSADSLLYALGYFDTINDDDIKYWFDRFPWTELFQNDQWLDHSFYRRYVPGSWMTAGARALLESSALYLELLHALGSTADVNETIWREFDSRRWPNGPPDPEEREFVYFGAFTELHYDSGGNRPPPYHLLPVCAFWALNGPLPHFYFRKEMAIRSDANSLSWGDVAPPAIFNMLLSRCLSNAREDFKSGDDLAFQAQRLTSVVEEVFGSGYLQRVGSEDKSYVDVCIGAADLGLSFRTALGGIQSDAKPESRFESFFQYPPSSLPLARYQVIETGTSSTITDNLKALLLSRVAEHLIPTWSERGTARFRTARRLKCPSAMSPDRALCPARKCSGVFPSVVNLPETCWFQKAAALALSLDVIDL